MILDMRGFEDFPARAKIQAQPGQIAPFAEDVVAVREVWVELAVQKSGDEYF